MTLIDDVLDDARVEAGRVDLAAEPFDVTALVEGVVELLAPRVQDKGLEIASWIDGGVPPCLLGDMPRLRQVLLNLAGNAIKFTDQGGVGVDVSRRADGMIVFSVADTGSGVPQSRRSAIFEEFEQADGTASRRQGGTGLGLAIAKTLVGAMGGEISLADREGGGSQFSFTVPLPAAEGSSASRGAIPAGRCALIVSSAVFQPAYLAASLEADGVVVLRAASRREAEILLGRFGDTIEDVFVDCGQGKTDAHALAAAAAQAGVARRILLFSPFERRAFGETLAADFDAWLVKPVRDTSLRQRLTETRPPQTAKVVAMARPPASRGSVRVLLAEDNPINALVARALLERLGAEVVHAENGLEAWKHVESTLVQRGRGFDLVLMDVCMPILDGLEVTRRIRAAEARHGLTPVTIVATTAGAFTQTRLDCERAGMDDVFVKPVQVDELRRLLAPSRVLAEA